MSIEINRAAVNSAGEDIVLARCYFLRGDVTMAHMKIKQAKAKLYEESKWHGDGHEQVQEFLNFVIGLDTDLIKIGRIDLSVPAAMFYWGRESFDDFLNRTSTRQAVPA